MARSKKVEPAQQTPRYESADERRARGRALRAKVQRTAHAGWKAAADRRDPVELVAQSSGDGLPALIPIRHGRMASSPFAFYRGAAALMAADLATTASSGILVQACGDAHLMNFGGFATPERNVIFDVNDLDETLPAPFEWDLKRLAASVVVAADHVRLPGSDAARLATDLVREYRERMIDYSAMRVLDVWYDKIDLRRYQDRSADPDVLEEVRRRVAERMDAAERKSIPESLYPKFVCEQGMQPRIKDEPPLIFHPDESLAPGLREQYAGAIAGYRDSVPEHLLTLFDRYRFQDLAIKVVGVGSVGTFCALALFMAEEDDPLFLQVKEARASVLEPYAGKSRHANHGQRVIVGQRLMQSASDMFLGWTEGADGRHYYVRQLRDLKMSAVIEDMDFNLLRLYARMCAHALARAHARSGDAAMIAGYAGSGEALDDAIADFAVAYSDQNRADYRAFVKAVRKGQIETIDEV